MQRREWIEWLDRAMPYILVGVVAIASWIAVGVGLGGAEGFRFARPWVLLLLAGVPLCGWALLFLERRRSGTFTFSRGLDLLRAQRGILDRLIALPRALRLGAVALVALALARPQTTSPDRDVEVEGIDIVLALDLSNSMEETDLLPNRLEAAKQVIDDFIHRRRNDRLGLVVFGREAFTQCPLTLDYAALRTMLRQIEIGLV